MKTAIPDELFDAAERAARRLGLTGTELYRRALAAFRERHSERVVTEALDEIYWSEPQESCLDPVLEHLQRVNVLPESW